MVRRANTVRRCGRECMTGNGDAWTGAGRVHKSTTNLEMGDGYIASATPASKIHRREDEAGRRQLEDVWTESWDESPQIGA